MPRYFQSIGAGRPITIGGRSFSFEPVEPSGGSWSGVLALDDESGASILAEAGLEISKESYDALKKKRTGELTAPGFVPSPMPQPAPQPIVVSAVRAEDRHLSSTFEEKKPEPVVAGEYILKTTSKPPPHEPLLVNEVIKRRKAA